jgi:hypothetical protein
MHVTQRLLAAWGISGVPAAAHRVRSLLWDGSNGSALQPLQRQKLFALFALPFDGTARSIVCVDTLDMTERWDASVSSELSIRNAQAALRTLIFPQSLPATM